MATTQEFRISDTIWKRLRPKLPVHVPKAHPLGCHKQRVPDRQVLDGIFFVLRTGTQWKALSATGICSGSTAHARFQEWVQAGVFAQLWDVALQDYENLIGLNFDWMALDGSLHKAPLGGKKPAPILRTAARLCPGAGGGSRPRLHGPYPAARGKSPS